MHSLRSGGRSGLAGISVGVASQLLHSCRSRRLGKTTHRDQTISDELKILELRVGAGTDHQHNRFFRGPAKKPRGLAHYNALLGGNDARIVFVFGSGAALLSLFRICDPHPLRRSIGPSLGILAKTPQARRLIRIIHNLGFLAKHQPEAQARANCLPSLACASG